MILWAGCYVKEDDAQVFLPKWNIDEENIKEGMTVNIRAVYKVKKLIYKRRNKRRICRSKIA